MKINKSEGYSNSTQEKLTRAALKSAVERSLASNSIVILDSMNYIKVILFLCFSNTKKKNGKMIFFLGFSVLIISFIDYLSTQL